MSNIVLTRKDVIWSYFAQIFSVSAGALTLPLILNMLTAEEIGMNYLMLTIGSLVTLFDFGFAPQFGRNITYVFSGVQELKKDGFDIIEKGNDINYRLLSTIIQTAKFVYRRIGFIVLFVMLTFGSLYIYYVTDGFCNVKNSFFIWIVYSISTFFNLYYSYYTSLLVGKGLIMESKKAIVYSKIAYIILSFSFLFFGMGLLGLVFANLISPFITRLFSYRYFFTTELKKKISFFQISSGERSELFIIIWYNAKKLGLVFLGSYAINKLSMFLAGLFLSLETIASYGLMIQLVGLISAISTTLFASYTPVFATLRIENNFKKILGIFAFTMNIYYLLFIMGTLFLLLLVPYVLSLMGSNVSLPFWGFVLLYCIIALLEGNHSNFAAFIVTKNNIPFVKSSLIAGGFIALGSYLSLSYTCLGILGLLIIQGIAQLVYANWKWPNEVCKEFGITFLSFLFIGLKETSKRIKIYCYNGRNN